MYPTPRQMRREERLLPTTLSYVQFTEERLRRAIPPARYLRRRRVAEIAAILLSSPVTIPLVLLIALAVRMDSPGPVFFFQERVGYRGARFRMIKLRSMRAGTGGGSLLTGLHDRRITRLGRLLRQYHLDELPQLWNVLAGEMSLIGPRPEAAVLAETFEQNIPLYHYRRIVPCGMTGWGQVNMGYAADIESTRLKLCYDLDYVTNISLRLDLKILYQTVFAVLTRYGSR